MKRQRLAEQWDQFAREVMPKEAGPVQRQEMRRAFYAGAWAIYAIQMNAMSPDGGVTNDDLRMMKDLDREMREFAKLIEQGRA